MASELLPPSLQRVEGVLHIGGVSCVELAESYGTPLYVMDERRIRENYRRMHAAFLRRWPNFRIFYAVKANSNLSVLRILRQEGAGADCSCLEEVSLAELAGFRREDILLTANYIDLADLKAAFAMGLSVNLDDPTLLEKAEFEHVPKRISMRINPGYGKGAFPGLVLAGRESKFGMSEELATKAYDRAKAMGFERFGIHMMAGSCVLDPGYFEEVARRLLDISCRIADKVGIEFEVVNVGGGFGVPYHPSEIPLDIELTAERITGVFKECFGLSRNGPKLAVEPGRYLVCDAGVLLARVRAVKRGEVPFIGVDAGMNTLLRPALYGAYHEVLLANRREEHTSVANLCGTICENTDILAKGRELPQMAPGDIVAILNAGSYGFSMSSQYNSRPRAAEALVNNGMHELIRERETLADIIGRQHVPRRLAE